MRSLNDNPIHGQPVPVLDSAINALRITSSTNCAIIVHGIDDSGKGLMSTVVRDALLTSGTTNVFVLDWEGGAIGQWAESFIGTVSQNAIEFIRLLVNRNKVSVARLHLIGFDMGAHIVGLVGRGSTHTIARITGLNPFKSLEGHFNSLTTDDANYVEVIHTETTTNGVLNAIGDVDFYPFGGNEQAGCTDAEDLGACSHNRAWELFAASLTHGRIIGYRCVNQDGATSDTPCTGFTLPLGTNDFIKYGSGLYNLETNAVYPYRCLIRCGLVDNIEKALESIAGGGGNDGAGAGGGGQED